MHTHYAVFGGMSKNDSLVVSFTDFHDWKSVFWHGLMHRAFVANATFILRFFLPTTKGTPFARLGITGLCFIISGAMHVAGSKVAIPSYNNGRHLFWFYCLNWIGIIVEDVVSMLHSHLVGSKIKSVSCQLGCVVGYIWTFLFMSWAIPKMYFPKRWRKRWGGERGADQLWVHFTVLRRNLSTYNIISIRTQLEARPSSSLGFSFLGQGATLPEYEKLTTTLSVRISVTYINWQKL